MTLSSLSNIAMWSLQNVHVTWLLRGPYNEYTIHNKNILFREYILNENSCTVIKKIQDFVISGDMLFGLPAG